MNDAIVFDDVWRRFGDDWVLRGLSFVARRGEVTALIGRNGAGKSTAIALALGFRRPHAGRVSTLGAEASELGAAERDRIGYVAEDHPLIRGMRLRRLIAFEAGTRPRFNRERVLHEIDLLGLSLKQRVGQLSRGQRAQVSITLALASDPELLILDDPALGLDVLARREVLEAVVDQLADRGTSVLFTSHVYSDIERLADRVVLVEGGSALLDAPLDELKSRLRHGWLKDSNCEPEGVAALPGVISARAARTGIEVVLDDIDGALSHGLSERGQFTECATETRLEEAVLAVHRASKFVEARSL